MSILTSQPPSSEAEVRDSTTTTRRTIHETEDQKSKESESLQHEPVDQYKDLGSPGALSGYSGFLRNSRFADSDSLRRSLGRLQAFTLHKPTRKHFQRRKIRVNFLNYVWGLDLIDMKSLKTKNSHFAWILVVQVS